MGVYRNSGKEFAALGDEHVLLILMQRNRLWTPDKNAGRRFIP